MVGIEEIREELKRRYSDGDGEAVGICAGNAAYCIFSMAKFNLAFRGEVVREQSPGELEIAETVRTYPNLVLRCLEDFAAHVLERTGYPLPKVKNEMDPLAAIAEFSLQLCGILSREA